MEKCPDDTLVAGRCCEGAVVAVEASQIFGEQRPDFKSWDVHLLICQEIYYRLTQVTPQMQLNDTVPQAKQPLNCAHFICSSLFHNSLKGTGCFTASSFFSFLIYSVLILTVEMRSVCLLSRLDL